MRDLPHAFPFRLVEPGGGSGRDDLPIAQPSLGSRLPRHPGDPGGAFPLTLAVEVMAQSVLAVPPRELATAGSSAGGAQLAGIEQARLLAVIAPGDRVEARAEVAGRFGPAAKVRCRLERGGETVAEAVLLLTLGA